MKTLSLSFLRPLSDFSKSASEISLSILSNYGREIGIAYQLADDLVDLETAEIKDKLSIPLLDRLQIKTIRNGSLKLKNIRKKPTRDSSKIRTLYIEEIKRHTKKAEQLGRSKIIPSSQYKNLLIETPTNIINKVLKQIRIEI